METQVQAETLRQLFRPNSVAVAGASNEEGTAGNVIMRNLTQGKFLGPVMPLHEEQEPIMGTESYRSVDTLPLTPDLAVLCTSSKETPRLIDEFGKRGTRAAVILSRGQFRKVTEERQAYHKELLKAARPHGLRILGPNCLGFISPNVGLNASLAHRDALPGKLAFISQSDSLFTVVLDWASSMRIGFSHFISLGDRADICLGHTMDYLNRDPHTRAVLLYIETILHARHFMSAARALARNKPVLVIKAGRSGPGALAAAVHSAAMLGSDDVYDAAFRRSGMLRVFDVDTLFDTVETLARSRPLIGGRLAILTNGGSPGFLASDELIAGGGALSKLSQETLKTLDKELGGAFSYANPLVIRSVSPPEMYETGIGILTKDKDVDAVLVMHVPTAAISSREVAQAVVRAAKKTKRNVLTSFMGIEDPEEARGMFADAGVPTYFTPEKAIRGFLNLVQYRRNQELLMQTPPSLPENFDPDTFAAKGVVAAALHEKRQMLDETESMEVLKAYDIPSVATRVTRLEDDLKAVVEAADELGYPVALKILSPDIQRKSLAGGVALSLHTPEDVHEAAQRILARVREVRPDARLLGFTVQRMVKLAGAHELSVEVVTDPVFGPTIRFGQGGSLAAVLAERVVAMPPLNMHLAQELVSRTRVYPLLKGYRDHPPADMEALCLTLVKISQLIIDIPEILEMEINPLYADDSGVLALDAEILVAKADATQIGERLPIRPYPRELEECTTLKDGRKVLLRPIRPEDEPDHYEFLEHVSAEDKRYRFFGNIGELPRSEMQKLTQIDYDREMAIVVRGEDESGREKTLGVVRAMTDPENYAAEFAILIRSDMKRLGLGRILMEKIIRYCKSRGTNRIIGQALLSNQGMAGLAQAVGFEVRKNYDEDVWDFLMYLNPS